MSSTQRFLKQIQPNSSLFTSSGAANMYEFVPAAANIVGNYPPGYVQTLGASVVTAVNALGANAVLRDMGKTIRAPVGSLTGSMGYFRQVQVLLPAPLPAGGYIGGMLGSNFGVGGTVPNADPNSSYLVVYIPAPVNGMLASGVSLYNGDVMSAGSM